MVAKCENGLLEVRPFEGVQQRAGETPNGSIYAPTIFTLDPFPAWMTGHNADSENSARE